MINCKGFGRKLSWPITGVPLTFIWNDRAETPLILSRVANDWGEIRISLLVGRKVTEVNSRLEKFSAFH